MTRKQVIFVLVALAIIAMIVVGITQKREKGKPVLLDTVQSGAFQDTISANGSLVPRTQVQIMSDVMGKIVELKVREGDVVEKGQFLLRIDDRDLKSEVQRQRAAVRIARIQARNQQVMLDKAEREFKRKQRLYQDQLISIEEFEAARTTRDAAALSLKQAEQNVAQSEAMLRKSMDLLDKTVIRSPIAGKVTALNKELGEQVIQGTVNVPGSIIMEISDMSAIDLEVEVNEIESARIRSGMDATVTIEALGDRTFPGRVVEIGQSAYRPTGRDVSVFKVKISLLKLDEAMKPGMSGKAEIQVAHKANALSVPIEAVRTEDDGSKFVFVFDHGKVRKTTVTTGLSNDSKIEIISGLKAGQQVITGPYRTLKNLKDGNAVREKKSE